MEQPLFRARCWEEKGHGSWEVLSSQLTPPRGMCRNQQEGASIAIGSWATWAAYRLAAWLSLPSPPPSPGGQLESLLPSAASDSTWEGRGEEGRGGQRETKKSS